MVKEIEKLKQQYLETKPAFTYEEGVSDLWSRMDIQKRPFYFSKIFIIAVILVIFSTGFFGIALSAVPNNPLYPIKEATVRTIEKASSSNKELNKKIENILLPTKVTPTPTLKPTQTPEPSDDPKEIEGKNHAEDEDKQEMKEGVKGEKAESVREALEEIDKDNKEDKHKNTKVNKEDHETEERKGED